MACETCKEVGEQIQKDQKSTFTALLHVPLDDLRTHKDIRETRDEKKRRNGRKETHRENLSQWAAAFMNTSGGKIYVHIEGLTKGDTLQHVNDIFVSELKRLLESEVHYHDYVCQTIRYNDCVLEYTIKETPFLVTRSYNTKVRNEHENTSPSRLQVIESLKKPYKQSTTRETTDTLDGDLYERCDTELKTAKGLPRDCTNVVQVVAYIWTDGKLRFNITSMAKLENGGTYLFGVNEEYPKFEGFFTNISEDKFKEEICNKIKKETCIFQNDQFSGIDPSELKFLRIKLHELVNGNSVLEVAISRVNGVIFYHREGPTTQYLVGDNSQKMPREEWLNRLHRTTDDQGVDTELIHRASDKN